LTGVPPVPPSASPAGTAPRWGLGDALAGIVAGFLASAVVGQIVLAAGGYDTVNVSSAGRAVGWAAGELGAGVEPVAPTVLPLTLVALLQVPLWLGLAGAPLVAVRVRGARLLEDFRWTMRPVDIPIGLATGIATQLVAVPLLYAPIFWILGRRDVSAEARSLTDRASGAGVLVLALVVVVGAPVIEELFFRGLLLRGLDRRMGPTPALVLSAVIFALVHFQPLQFPALVLFGLVAGLLVRRTDRLGTAVWAHVGFNLTTVVVLLAAS
jgi:hypothetical protein